MYTWMYLDMLDMSQMMKHIAVTKCLMSSFTDF